MPKPVSTPSGKKSRAASKPGAPSVRKASERAHRNSAKLKPSTIDPTLPPPVTPADRIVLEIRKFIASSIFFNSQAADRIGLSLTDMQVLHMLQLYGPSTPGRLAQGTGLSSGGVTVALDRLENAGYIRREPNPADRRSLLIHLVPARLAKLAALYEGVEAGTRRQLATLSPRDLEAVIRFFEAMHSARVGSA